MHQNISIAVAIEAEAIGVLKGNPSEDQGPTGHKAMDVVAIADAQLHRCCGVWLHSSGLDLPTAKEIRSPFSRALFALLLTPAFNRCMVTTAQNIRNRESIKLGGPCVMRVLEKKGRPDQ